MVTARPEAIPPEIWQAYGLSDHDDVSIFGLRGNINLDTFLVSRPSGDYLLQRINEAIFPFPERMIETMGHWSMAQERYRAERHDLAWQPVMLAQTQQGAHSVTDHRGRTWRMMHRIGNAVGYRRLEDLPDHVSADHIAYEMGKGLALSHRMAETMDADRYAPSLPGYRDVGIYLAQHDAVMGGECAYPVDPEIRETTEPFFHLGIGPAEQRRRLAHPAVQAMLDEIEARRAWAMSWPNRMATGELRRSMIHGDTKLENFLFDADTHEAIALVDLDTIMPHTWLSDWGDMMRSLTNRAGEMPDHDDIHVDWEIYNAAERGYLDFAPEAHRPEIGEMRDAAKRQTFEQALRFLTDYLRGDTYYGTGDGTIENLNLRRAQVQFGLLGSFEQ